MNHSRYRVMGLTNGTVYTVEVRAVNAIESGPVAGASAMPREPGAIRATLAIAPASPVAENVGTVTVTVTAANNAPTPLEAPVELSLATADGTAIAGEDYVALSQTVTFAVSNFALVDKDTHYEASSNVMLTITDDDVDEGDETFTIVLEPSGDSAGSVSRPPDLIVTIAEDDEAPGAPTLTAEPGDAEVTLKWTAPASAGTSTIDGYDYRVSEQTVAPFTWDPDWTAIAGGAGATSVTVTMHGSATLANGTPYTFEVRARSAAGGGEAAQVSTKPGEVCGRTKQIADAIVAEASVSRCGDVTTTHLAGITELVTTVRGAIPALKSGDFAGLSTLTKLQMFNNGIHTLPTDIFTGLTALQELHLGASNFANGTVPAGVFSGLTALKRLYLSGSNLRNPPPGLFSALSALEELQLDGNHMTTLPSGLFAGLASLKTLYIIDNQLSSLPAGTFNGLTSLVSVWAQSNTVDLLPLSVTLEKVGEDGFQARVVEGATFDIELPLAITGGTIDGGATSITVAKGSVTSDPLEVTRNAGSTDAVSVDIGTLPGLPTDFDPDRGMTFGRYHQGYELVKSDGPPPHRHPCRPDDDGEPEHRPRVTGRRRRRHRHRHGDRRDQPRARPRGGRRGDGRHRRRHRNGGRGLRELERDHHVRNRGLRAGHRRHPLRGVRGRDADGHRRRPRRRR